MFLPFQQLAEEQLVTVQELQRSPQRVLTGTKRIMKGKRSLGVFFSNEKLENLMEEWALNKDPEHKKRVAQAKKNMKSGKGITLSSLMKKYGV